MLIVAAFTFREARRKRLVLAVALLSAAFLGLFALMAHVITGNPGAGLTGVAREGQGAAVALFGVYLARSFAGLLAILVAVGAISGEIDSGALQSVLARPVSRASVVLGKFIGFGALLVVYTAALQSAVLLLGRVLAGARVPHPVAVVALLCCEPLVLLALALCGSTFLPTLVNGAAAVLLYGMAVVGGDLEQLGAFIGNRKLDDIGIVTSLVLPTDVLYRKAFAVGSSGMAGIVGQALGPVFGSLSQPSALMLVYALVYLCALLAVAVWVFSRRDV